MARESGYVIRIDGFLPVDKSSLASQKAAIDALSAAIDKGDLEELIALLDGIKIKHAFASRAAPEPVAATVTAAKPRSSTAA